MNKNLGKLDDRSFLNFIIRIVDESTLIIGEFILYNKIWALTKDLTSIPSDGFRCRQGKHWAAR